MCAIEVFKCLNGVSSPECEKYFICLYHCKGTCRNDHSLLLPKVKSEAGRRTFAFLDARTLNKLPSNMKNESSIVKFKTACKYFNFDS